jgi:hypothetical protein
MLFAGLEEHTVAWADDFDRTAASLGAADALENVDCLPIGVVCQAVRAPGVKWTLLALRREGPAGVATGSM